MARTRDVEAIRAVARRISSVDDVDPHVKVLVFGHNGSGKTRFAATAPKCLIIDINEAGTRSAVGSGAKKVVVDNWPDIGHLYWYLKAAKHNFESVAIDTLTAMNMLAMRFVLGEAEDRDPARVKDMPDKRTYGKTGQLMTSMIWAFRNLPMHVVFTAQVRTITDDDTGEVLDYAVDLPAGSRGAANGAVSVLGYLEPREVRVRDKNGKVTRRWTDHMLLGPNHEYSSLKDRTNQLGPILKNPTMPAVIEAWHNTNTED